ncbi:MAG TPA: hypothetical protein VNT29_11160 [Candidatus Limnocylindrales bacterium]|nr:hypothetical protein [Candidatus Limnocylindrales bacterium]
MDERRPARGRHPARHAQDEAPVLLPIVPKARAALDACRKRPVMSEYVLLTPEGKPYSESTIKRYFQTAKAIAGIHRRFRFHD